MIKFIAKNGIMLSCGWLPPEGPTMFGAMAADGAAELYQFTPAGAAAYTLPPGEVEEPVAELACGAWLWDGIWFVVSVTDSSPAICPST